MSLLRTILFALAALLVAAGAHAQIAFRAAAQAANAAPPAAIALRGVGGFSEAANGNVSPPLPAGTAAGDFLLVIVESKDDVAPTMTTGGGFTPWTLLDSQISGAAHRASLFWKIAQAGEPTPTVVHPGGARILAQMLGFSGVDATSPFETAHTFTSSPADSTTEGTGVSTASNQAMLVFTAHMADRYGSYTITAGGPLIQSFTSNSGGGGINRAAIGAWHALRAPGAQPDITLTRTAGGGSAAVSHGGVIALRPAGVRIDVPAGTVAGDLMLATIAVRPSTVAINAPPGWTAQPRIDQPAGNSSGQQLFYRVAGAAEPASYTWTFSAGSTGAAGGIVSYSGVDTVAPFDAFAGNVTPSGASHTANGVTTSVLNTMLISTHSFSSAETWTSPAGMTERVDVASLVAPNAGGISLQLNEVLQAGAGATLDKTATVAGNADTGVAHLFALRPDYTHYAVLYPNGASLATCEPALVHIEAHHAGHGFAAPRAGTTLTINTSSGTGVWLSPAIAGTGAWTPSGANNGVATYTWPGTEAVLEVRLRHNTPVTLQLNLSDTQGKSEAAAEDPSLSFADSVLRVTADGATGANVGTQIAGKRSDEGFGAQTLFVQAVATVPATGACTTLFQGQNVDVEFAAECDNRATCSAVAGTSFEVQDRMGSFVSVAKNNDSGAPGSYTPISLAFSNDANAMAPFTFRYNDAGQMTLYMRSALPSPPGGTIAGTSNAFVTRPFAFAFRGANDTTAIQHGTLPTSSLLAAAGDAFTMTLAAYRWSSAEDDGTGNPLAGADITDNGLTPNFSASTAVSASANLPGAAAGSIGRGAGCAGAATVAPAEWSGGAVTPADWCYSEAGNVFLAASSSDYISAGVNVSGNSGLDGTGAAGGYVGRFKPKHFVVTGAPTLTNRQALACASTFSYMNEGLRLGFTLEARNAQNVLTQNYTGAYAKLDLTSAANLGIGARSGAMNLTARVDNAMAPAGSFTNGVANLTAVTGIRRASPDNPDGPYPATQFGIAPNDNDPDAAGGVKMQSFDLDVDGDATNEHFAIGPTTELRFGRLRLQNAYGPVSQALPIPLEVQYWNGSGFVTNALDDCTALARANIALSFSGAVNACETAVTQPSIAFASGAATLTLSAPGTGNTGTVLLTPQFGTAAGTYCPASPGGTAAASASPAVYLLGRWDDAANPDADANTSYDDKPAGQAGFGLYGSQPRNFIFFRENY